MYTKTNVDYFVCEETRLETDYLSPRASTLTAPSGIKCELRNTIRVLDDDNFLIYVGFISAIDRDDKKTLISAKPVMALLDEISLINTNQSNYAWQIYQQILNVFGSLQNPTGGSLYPVPWSFINGYIINNWQNEAKIYNDAPLMSVMDLVIDARTLCNRWMRFDVGATTNNLGCPCYGFEKNADSIIVEADLDSIIEREISVTNKGGYNVGFIWNWDADLQGWAYFPYVLNDDGTIEIDTWNNKRKQMADARITNKRFDKAVTRAEADEIIKTMLSPSQTNFCIKIKVKKDYPLFKFKEYNLGQECDVIYNGITYKTNLTGWAIEGDVVEYTFGTLRESLTDILNREKG